MASKSRKSRGKKKSGSRSKPAPESQVREWELTARDHFEWGEFERAKDIYHRILNDYPDYHTAIHNLGMIHQKRGEPEKALEFFNRSIEREPASATYHFNLGNLFIELSRTGEGEEALRRTIELEPGHVSAHNNLGPSIFGRAGWRRPGSGGPLN